MIKRKAEITLRKLSRQFKAVAVIGPRQSGKTTLAKFVFPGKPYVNLENPDTRRFAKEDPRGFLAQFPDGAVLDEAQRQPDLFSYLQQILDETRIPGKFIITGSNNFLLQENISQSLAGRIAYLVLLPFAASELPEGSWDQVTTAIFKGFYPPVFDQPVEPSAWYANYLRTYVERDVRQLKNITDLNAFERFLRLCAGRAGQLLNMSNLAIETGVDSKTIASWISVLESSFIIFRLQPHHRNFNKRIVKMPKLYFYDTGLACSLLGIQNPSQLLYHPLTPSLFENLAISEMIKFLFNRAKGTNLFFWRDNVGHEIDVIIDQGNLLHPVEIKSGQTITPEYFRNLAYWQSLYGAPGGTVVYSGASHQRRSNGIEILPWRKVEDVFSKKDVTGDG
jgi:predicted AAA+ superfamily ATPase